MLGLLYTNPMHGYLLRKQAQEFSWIYPMSNTNVYPALHSLEQDGFVKHDSEIFDGRARKVYSITEPGREEFGRWLADPSPQKSNFRDVLLLKISMMGDVPIPGARPWIQSNLDQLDIDIENSDRAVKEAEMGRYTRLAMEYGVDMLRQRARFLQKVLDAAEETTESVEKRA